MQATYLFSMQINDVLMKRKSRWMIFKASFNHKQFLLFYVMNIAWNKSEVLKTQRHTQTKQLHSNVAAIEVMIIYEIRIDTSFTVSDCYTVVKRSSYIQQGLLQLNNTLLNALVDERDVSTRLITCILYSYYYNKEQIFSGRAKHNNYVYTWRIRTYNYTIS